MNVRKTPPFIICLQKCENKGKSSLEKHLETLKKREVKSRTKQEILLNSLYAKDEDDTSVASSGEDLYVFIIICINTSFLILHDIILQ